MSLAASLTPSSLSSHPSPRIRQLYLSLCKALDSALSPDFSTEFIDCLSPFIGRSSSSEEFFKSSFIAAFKELRNNIEEEFCVILQESPFLSQFDRLDRLLLESRLLSSIEENSPLSLEEPRKIILKEIQKEKEEELKRLEQEIAALEQDNAQWKEKIVKQRVQVEETMKILKAEKLTGENIFQNTQKWE